MNTVVSLVMLSVRYGHSDYNDELIVQFLFSRLTTQIKKKTKKKTNQLLNYLVLLFVALWFVLRAICFNSCLALFCSCVFSVLLALRLPRLGKRELILVLFVRLFDLRLFGFPLPLGV